MPDPDMLDPAGSISEPDPNHLDPDPYPAGSGFPNFDYCQQQEKNSFKIDLSAPQLEKLE